MFALSTTPYNGTEIRKQPRKIVKGWYLFSRYGSGFSLRLGPSWIINFVIVLRSEYEPHRHILLIFKLICTLSSNKCYVKKIKKSDTLVLFCIIKYDNVFQTAYLLSLLLILLYSHNTSQCLLWGNRECPKDCPQ